MNHKIKIKWITSALLNLLLCSCKSTGSNHSNSNSDLFIAEQSLYDWPAGFEVAGKKTEYKDISAYWVPAEIKDNKLIEAHKVWLIEGDSQWIQK